MKVETISVSSRRSSSVGKEYFTFECSMTVAVGENENVDEVYQTAWDKVNTEVDNQMQEVVS